LLYPRRREKGLLGKWPHLRPRLPARRGLVCPSVGLLDTAEPGCLLPPSYGCGTAGQPDQFPPADAIPVGPFLYADEKYHHWLFTPCFFDQQVETGPGAHLCQRREFV